MKTFKHVISRFDETLFSIFAVVSVLVFIIGFLGNFIVKDKFPIFMLFQVVTFSIICSSFLCIVYLNKKWQQIIKDVRSEKLVYKKVRDLDYKRSKSEKFIVPFSIALLEASLMIYMYYGININILMVAYAALVVFTMAFMSYLAFSQYNLFCTLAKGRYCNKHTKNNLYNFIYKIKIFKDRILFLITNVVINLIVVCLPLLVKYNFLTNLEKLALNAADVLVRLLGLSTSINELSELLITGSLTGIAVLLLLFYVHCFHMISKHSNKFTKRLIISKIH